MKFIHCADVHLDTPLQGLAEYPGAPIKEIRNATRRAFEKVLDAAISENVDFLIIAGDLYDTGLKSFESALFFNKQMARLADAGIDVYLIYGNHDAASKLIKQLRPPKNVHIFRSTEPHSFSNDKLRVAIHGQSFSTPEITEDLAANYPPPVPGFFNIGVLHTNLGGSFGPRELRPVFAPDIEEQRLPILGARSRTQPADSLRRSVYRVSGEHSGPSRKRTGREELRAGHCRRCGNDIHRDRSPRQLCHGLRPALMHLVAKTPTRSTTNFGLLSGPWSFKLKSESLRFA